MGKQFWLCYVAVAALSCALVWWVSPVVGEKLPPDVRARICQSVDETAALFLGQKGDEPPNGSAATADDSGLADGIDVTNAITTSQTSHAIRNKNDPNRTPVQRGVHPVDPIHAAWGVLIGITPVEDIDGKSIGTAPGGRFFKIKETISTPSGLKITGTFVSRKMTSPVRIPAEKISCFSGTYLFLSTNQQVCLRKYYELNGEAQALKAKLIRESSMKSPYIQAAADALRELRARERAAEKIKPAATDELRKATYEISQLRSKVQDLNRKHKDWKAEHAAEMPNPDQNPAYREILARRNRYAAPIKSMVESTKYSEP